MKYIIPTSQSDIHRAREHALILKHFGGFENRELIYFATPSVEDEVHEIAAINGASVMAMELEPTSGWPVGPNQQFSALVLLLGAMNNTDHFLWMEPDMVPIRKGWQTALENELIVKGTPFMGNIVPFGMSKNGKIVYSEGDTMMMGCGVYPPHMHSDERICWAIVNLGKQGSANPRINNSPVGFDVYLRNPMKSFGMSDTKLISDQWNTGEYFEDEGGLHCEALPFDRPHRKRGGTIDPEAVLVHGCKDGSLEKLLFGAVTSPPAGGLLHAAFTEEVVTNDREGTLEEQLAEDMESEAELAEELAQDDPVEVSDTTTEAPPYEAPHVPSPPPAPKTVPAAKTVAGFDSIDWDRTNLILATLKKDACRAPALATKIKYARWKLERDLAKLGFKVVHSGWIKPTDELLAAVKARKAKPAKAAKDEWA